MPTIDSLFPKQNFTSTELAEIANAVNQPALKKYFRKVASDIVEGLLLGEPKENESDGAYLRRQARAAGNLETLEILLNIVPPMKTDSLS